MSSKTFMLLLGPMTLSQMLTMISTAKKEGVELSDIDQVRTEPKVKRVVRRKSSVKRGKDSKPRKRRTVLTKRDAQELYRLRSYETNYLVRKFNVSKSTVARVVNRQGRYKRMNLK